MYDSFRPRDEQVAISGVVHLIDRSGTRRPPSDLAEHHLTIGFAVPLHVGESGTEAERGQRLATHLTAALQVRHTQVAQHDDAGLIHS